MNERMVPTMSYLVDSRSHGPRRVARPSQFMPARSRQDCLVECVEVTGSAPWSTLVFSGSIPRDAHQLCATAPDDDFERQAALVAGAVHPSLAPGDAAVAERRALPSCRSAGAGIPLRRVQE